MRFNSGLGIYTFKLICFRHNKGIDGEHIVVDAEEEERFAHVEGKQVRLASSCAVDFIFFAVKFLLPRYFSSKTAHHACSTRFWWSASLGTQVLPITRVSKACRNIKLKKKSSKPILAFALPCLFGQNHALLTFCFLLAVAVDIRSAWGYHADHNPWVWEQWSVKDVDSDLYWQNTSKQTSH